MSRRSTFSACLIAAIALLTAHGVPAQAPPGPWVVEIGAPQYFAILVADVERSVDWYRTVFGLEERGGSAAADGSWRIENLGNEQLLVEIIRDDRAQEVDRALGFRKVGFQVADVEAVADRVLRATGERPRVVEFERFGLRIVQIADPDGNVIQLSSPLRPSEDAGAGISESERVSSYFSRDAGRPGGMKEFEGTTPASTPTGAADEP